MPLPPDHLDNVIPEQALINNLAPQWQLRFEKAITLLRSNLNQPFNWQCVAQHCATSANHFHVMFRTVFGETPAAYHRRLRLKQVLFELYFEPSKSITDIALDAGFSTSQSLAKILKREFNLSAKEIRKQDTNASFEKLRVKLEHVVSGESQESKLSKNIKFSTITLDEQYLFLKTCSTQDIAQITAHWKSMAPKKVNLAVSLSPWRTTEDMSIPFKIGYHCSPEHANTLLNKQSFLTCRIKIIDGTSYFASWEALYLYAMQQGYQIQEDFGLLEYCHNPRAILSLSSDLTLMLPISSLAQQA